MLGKKSKGFGVIPSAVGIMLAIGVTGATLAMTGSVFDQSVTPNVKKANKVLETQIGGKVYIGKNVDGREGARRQMQSLIGWNMMAASDCRVMLALHTTSSVYQSQEDFDVSDLDSKFENDIELMGGSNKAFKLTPESLLKATSHGRGNAYTGNFLDISSLVKNTSFEGRCIGGKSMVKKVEDATKDAQHRAWEGALDTVADIGTAAVGGVAGLATTAGCLTFTAGAGSVGCAAAGVSVGGAIASTSDQVAAGMAGYIAPGASTNLGSEPSADMEGKFGRTPFEVNRTFVMGTNRPFEKPFLGFTMNISQPSKAPGFWTGKRFSYLLPPGLQPPTSGYDLGPFHEGWLRIKGKVGSENHPTIANSHFKEDLTGDEANRAKMALYAFRPRMVNVPILGNDGLRSTVSSRSNNGKLIGFLSNSRYVFCKGAEGYVQSNAGRIDNNGEATSNNGTIEDQVYPKVKIEENATSCFKVYDGDVSTSAGPDCSLPRHALRRGEDSKQEVWSREKANGETHSAYAFCGADPESIDLGGYGTVSENYYNVDKVVTGCDLKFYQIKGLAETSTLDTDGDYLVFDHSDSDNNLWHHNYQQDGTSTGDNYLSYNGLKFVFNRSSGIKTYKIILEGQTGSTSVTKSISILKYPSADSTYKVVFAPGSNIDSDGYLEKHIAGWNPDSSAEDINLKVSKGGNWIKMNGEKLQFNQFHSGDTSWQSSNPPISGPDGTEFKITDIKIKLIDENSEFPLQYSGSSPTFSNSNLALEKVRATAQPRICG